ncbi:MAG: 30S ribosome-binding factor RbfA [Lachnospiraceae bacterium]|nr:30S ribosome-binding factor RbfA [Lachnospiraceae bacterium]
MRKNSIKNIRVSQEVLRELSSIIRDEVHDPRIDPFTSVVDVYVAPDLKTCKVWVSVLGDDESKKNTLKGLNSAAGFIRGKLAHTMNMRNTPELTFVVDRTIEYGVNMSKKIDDVMAAMPKRDEEEPEGQE